MRKFVERHKIISLILHGIYVIFSSLPFCLISKGYKNANIYLLIILAVLFCIAAFSSIYKEEMNLEKYKTINNLQKHKTPWCNQVLYAILSTIYINFLTMIIAFMLGIHYSSLNFSSTIGYGFGLLFYGTVIRLIISYPTVVMIRHIYRK